MNFLDEPTNATPSAYLRTNIFMPATCVSTTHISLLKPAQPLGLHKDQTQHVSDRKPESAANAPFGSSWSPLESTQRNFQSTQQQAIQSYFTTHEPATYIE